MNNMRISSIFLFVVFLFGCDGGKVSNKISDTKTDAKESVSIVLDEYFENGVMGMIALSKDCHENAATSKINCIGIDVAAHLWDFNVTNSLKVPNEEYFSVSNNRIRAETYVRIKNLNLVLDDYIQLLAEESYAQIPAEWEKQKHKLD